MAVIQNTKELGTSKLRQDALAILEAGYAAIETKAVIAKNVQRDGNTLSIRDTSLDLSQFRRVFVIGIGKCSRDAGEVLEEILGDVIAGGFILDVEQGTFKKLTSVAGTHPLPTDINMQATESIAKLLDEARADDLIITVISGGGSALLCLPNQLTCEQKAYVADTLMDKGADIAEINTVRKHLSQIKGGQFAKRAYPARVVSLIFSDVPHNDMSLIASGPTAKDETTVSDAQRIIKKYCIPEDCADIASALIETPKEKKYFERVSNILVLSNETALHAMAEKADELGFNAEVVTTSLEGEAREVGSRLLAQAGGAHDCKLYGGETTVKVVNEEGKGGRNQEVVLGALGSAQAGIPEGTLITAVASDGWDNGDVAGAFADAAILAEAKKQGLDPHEYLDRNDSYRFFEHTGGHIKTGRLESNVADLYITLKM